MVRFLGVALAVAVTAALVSAADPPPLKGTFVREMIVSQQMGNQIVLTFDNGHLTAKMTSGGRADDGHEGWITLTFDGEYAVTPGGLCCGVVTGINADMSKIPMGDMANAPLGESAHKLIGEPFSFRARATDKGLVVTDVKVPQFETVPGTPKAVTGREMVTAFASGTYAKSETDKVPVPKLARSKGGEAAVLEVIEGLFGPIMRTEIKGYSLPPPMMVNNGPGGVTVTPLPPGERCALPPLPQTGPVVYAQQVPTTPDGLQLPAPVRPAGGTSTAPSPRTQADQLMNQSDRFGPPGAFPVTPITPTPVRIEGGLMDDKPHDGTWVREFVVPDAGGGMQSVITFKGERLTARFTEFAYGDDGKMKSGSFEFECSYHRTADGYVIGRVVGVELDMKNAPLENGVTPDTFKGLNKVYGEPFCFRCDVCDGVMSVADLRMPTPEGLTQETNAVRDTAIAFVGGKYKKSETATVPLPKVERRKYEPPKMEKTMNGIRMVTPFTPHPDLPMTVRATSGPLPGPMAPPMPAPYLMPTPPALIPTAGQMPAPGTMRATPVPPMVREAWEQSTMPALPYAPPIPPSK